MTYNQIVITMMPINIIIGFVCGWKIKNFYLAIFTPVIISIALNKLLALILL